MTLASHLLRRFACAAMLWISGLPAAAQDPETVIINLRNAEIATLAEQVSEITGRTLVLDPLMSGDITVVSAEPLDRAGVWSLFQSILEMGR